MGSCTASTIPVIAAVVSAMAAIFAAIISAVIAGRLSRRGRVSEFRQQWVNDQRADIADYLDAVKRHQHLYDEPATNSSSDAERHDHLRLTREEADRIYYRIKLRINPRENPHRRDDDRFMGALDDLVDSTALPNRDPEFDVRFDAALAEAQEFLKREWEVTKNGK